MQCKSCSQVTLANGEQVWVCQNCGAEHQPGEGQVVADAAAAGAQAVVDQAAAATPAPVIDPMASAASEVSADAGTMPAAPADSTDKPAQS
ncbi:MAG: hypothetical protein Q7S31_02320 [bacterium]|nr:hypothetical protein [bacterium]